MRNPKKLDLDDDIEVLVQAAATKFAWGKDRVQALVELLNEECVDCVSALVALENWREEIRSLSPSAACGLQSTLAGCFSQIRRMVSLMG